MRLELPDIGLGTSGMTGDECVESVRTALETGFRHVDTAQMYDNEPAVGAGIRLADVDRDDVVLARYVFTPRTRRMAQRESVKSSRCLGQCA